MLRFNVHDGRMWRRPGSGLRHLEISTWPATTETEGSEFRALLLLEHYTVGVGGLSIPSESVTSCPATCRARQSQTPNDFFTAVEEFRLGRDVWLSQLLNVNGHILAQFLFQTSTFTSCAESFLACRRTNGKSYS